jgi:6-phosphogluconolactonase
VYFGDDRCVPPDHESSNYRAARESLLDHVPIPREQIHRIEGERAPAEAAASYNALVAAVAPIDVIVLGMGDDGHTASLFPGEAEPPAGLLVAATHSPVAPHDRVTMTLPAIRACGTVILQVTGANKAARLAQVYAELQAGTPNFPVAKIGPAIWMIDEAAAALIPRSDR